MIDVKGLLLHCEIMNGVKHLPYCEARNDIEELLLYCQVKNDVKDLPLCSDGSP